MKPLLTLNQVTLRIQQMLILKDIQVEIFPNDFMIILGSNGSGKSSLLKLIDSHYKPTTGKIFFQETMLQNFPTNKLRQEIKTLTQDFNASLFLSLTVYENCLLADKKMNPKSCASYLETFNPNLSQKLNILVEHLSGGEKQALALAMIMRQPPKILLLDEHTSALDPNASTHLMQLTQKIVEQFNITCLLTTHNLNIATQYGNRILSLREGKIHSAIDNKNSVIINQNDLLSACY